MKHHGKRQCHKGNQKDHHWILRFFHLKITDKQHSDYYHCHMDHQKEIFPASSSQQIKERKDETTACGVYVDRMIAIEVIGRPW